MKIVFSFSVNSDSTAALRICSGEPRDTADRADGWHRVRKVKEPREFLAPFSPPDDRPTLRFRITRALPRWQRRPFAGLSFKLLRKQTGDRTQQTQRRPSVRSRGADVPPGPMWEQAGSVRQGCKTKRARPLCGTAQPIRAFWYFTLLVTCGF